MTAYQCPECGWITTDEGFGVWIWDWESGETRPVCQQQHGEERCNTIMVPMDQKLDPFESLYIVTCPECEAQNLSEWMYIDPGGVAPVQCAGCGYWILSETEGNPQRVSRPSPIDSSRGES